MKVDILKEYFNEFYGMSIRRLNQEAQDALLDEGYSKSDLISDEVIDLLEQIDMLENISISVL